MTIKWDFPLLNGGEREGVHFAAIETFKDDPVMSIGKEAVQNVLDAKSPDILGPAVIEFQLYTLPIDKFPDKDGYIETLELCKTYRNNNNDDKEMFNRAINIMEQNEIKILKISDYNTIGLTGADKSDGSNWCNLVMSSGECNKTGESGGSFGIGKHSFFACSGINTVFFGTRASDGISAFQGVSKLGTHLNQNLQLTRGTGYFWNSSNQTALYDFTKIDSSFIGRDQFGTDIYIPGFLWDEYLEQKLIISILDNFFIAVKNEKLSAVVGSTRINSDTLSELINTYMDEDSLTHMYYQSMINPAKIFKEPFQDIGELELYALPNKRFKKRVAMVRSNGMKIFDKDKFHLGLRFVGVMVAHGEELNRLLRLMENPTHDKWEPNRNHQERKKLEKLKKDIYSWVTENIKTLDPSAGLEEINFDVGNYLPDELDEDFLINDNQQAEGQKRGPKPIEVNIKPFRKPNINRNAEKQNAEGARGTDQRKQGKGGKKGVIRKPGSSGQNFIDPAASGKGTNIQTSKDIIRPKINRLRVFCTDPEKQIYNISFSVDSDTKTQIALNIIGEAEKEAAVIESASQTGSTTKLQLKGNKIGPIAVKKDELNSLYVTLNESTRCALEVTAIYEN